MNKMLLWYPNRAANTLFPFSQKRKELCLFVKMFWTTPAARCSGLSDIMRTNRQSWRKPTTARRSTHAPSFKETSLEKHNNVKQFRQAPLRIIMINDAALPVILEEPQEL